MKLTENKLRKIIRDIILEGTDNHPDKKSPKSFTFFIVEISSVMFSTVMFCSGLFCE